MTCFFTVLLITGCVWMSGLRPVASVADAAPVVETSEDGHIRVVQKQIRNQRYETLQVNVGRYNYRVPDERVSDVDTHGHRFFYNEEDPETRYDHEFYSSPRGHWLFVTRKLFHRVGVGYLYRLYRGRATQIRPQGLRFDEAALRFFSRRLHFPYAAIGAGARTIYFDRFRSDRLVFDFNASPRYDGRGPNDTVVGYYGLQSGNFGLICWSRNVL